MQELIFPVMLISSVSVLGVETGSNDLKENQIIAAYVNGGPHFCILIIYGIQPFVHTKFIFWTDYFVAFTQAKVNLHTSAYMQNVNEKFPF